MGIFNVGVFIYFEKVLSELLRIFDQEVIVKMVLNSGKHLFRVDFPPKSEYCLARLNQVASNQNCYRKEMELVLTMYLI